MAITLFSDGRFYGCQKNRWLNYLLLCENLPGMYEKLETWCDIIDSYFVLENIVGSVHTCGVFFSLSVRQKAPKHRIWYL